MKVAHASSNGRHTIMLCAGLAQIRSSKHIQITKCAAAIYEYEHQEETKKQKKQKTNLVIFGKWQQTNWALDVRSFYLIFFS